MNVGMSTGIPASIAGIPIAQTSGGEADRVRTETASQRQTQAAEAHAEKAAGIGETDGEDHQTDDRDADGRRPWEFGPPKQIVKPPPDEETSPRQSLDVTGDSGQQLDLTG